MVNGPDTALGMSLQDDPATASCAGPDGDPAMSPASDSAVAGAFDAFFRTQYRGLVQFLRRRTPTEQDAEDAAQESLTRLLRYRESTPEATWKPLLYRIATNIAHDQQRMAVSHRDRSHLALDGLPAEQEPVADTPTPEDRALHQQQVARLAQAILQLPPKCQKVYLLKRVHNLKRAEIARRCGISVKMVEKHLATALAQLRYRVGDSHTDAL